MDEGRQGACYVLSADHVSEGWRSRLFIRWTPERTWRHHSPTASYTHGGLTLVALVGVWLCSADSAWFAAPTSFNQETLA